MNKNRSVGGGSNMAEIYSKNMEAQVEGSELQSVEEVAGRLNHLADQVRHLNSGDGYSLLEADEEGKAIPDGFAGNLLVELQEAQREEEAECAFILERARTLAWQAVRYTPAYYEGSSTCRAWISRAHLWAERRGLGELACQLRDLLDGLDRTLPMLYRH